MNMSSEKQGKEKSFINPSSILTEHSEFRQQRNLFHTCLITKQVQFPITQVGGNIATLLRDYLKKQCEGKCIVEGYILQNSIKVLTYSCGLIKGANILYEVVFECQSCFPVEGMKFEAVVTSITKSGIKAEIKMDNDVPSPVQIHVSKDHHYTKLHINEIKEDDVISIKVIGKRFELNDLFIGVIGKLLKINPISGGMIESSSSTQINDSDSDSDSDSDHDDDDDDDEEEEEIEETNNNEEDEDQDNKEEDEKEDENNEEEKDEEEPVVKKIKMTL